jgi:hypothetical protein
MRFVTLLLALAIAPAAHATTAGIDSLSLRVGQSVEFNPGFLPAQVVCDDTRIVMVEDAGKAFRLTALKPGSTLCGFSSIAIKSRRRVVEVTVTP